MNGLAIVIPYVDFSYNSLGKVTPVTGEEIPLVSLTISGADSVSNGNTSTYSVSYTPSNTTERGVSWSVSQGNEYATINQGGKLSVLPSATEERQVTIRATSTKREDVYAEKVVSVRYQMESADIPVTGISITGASTIAQGVSALQLGIAYTPDDTTQRGIEWQSSDGTIASVNGDGLVSVTLEHRYLERQVTIKAISTANGEVTAQKTITIEEEQAMDYTHDGLVADYDAIDNLGTGIHSNSANKWADKAGGYDMNIRMPEYTKYWKDKAYDLSGLGSGQVTDVGFTRSDTYPLQDIGTGDFTVEIAFTTNSGMYDAHLGFFLYAYSTGRYQFAIHYKTSDGKGFFKCSTYDSGWKDNFYIDEEGEKVAVTNANEFHVAAFTRQGDTWKVYDNGILRGSFILADFKLLSVGTTMLLAQDGQPFAYHGYKFYNKALTAKEAARNWSFANNYYK